MRKFGIGRRNSSIWFWQHETALRHWNRQISKDHERSGQVKLWLCRLKLVRPEFDVGDEMNAKLPQNPCSTHLADFDCPCTITFLGQFGCI